MSDRLTRKPAPNPAVLAFFRSTTWKLLIAADFAAVILGAGLYVLTKNILSFAPLVLVGLILTFTLFKLARQGASKSGEDQLVQ